jgi:cytochrome P450
VPPCSPPGPERPIVREPNGAPDRKDAHMASEIVFDQHADIREAFYNPHLSRGVDERSFEEGNQRAGVLSVLHGKEHKERRRLENKLFRGSTLIEYEVELFPGIVQQICDRSAVGDVDLLKLNGSLAVVLAARRAGLDHDGSPEQLQELWGHAVTLAQAAALQDVVIDEEAVRAEVAETLVRFDEKYVTPSRRRREELLDAIERGETDEPASHDLLTVALQQRRRGGDSLDDALLVREAGLYLHGGSHTSAQTACNAFYYLLGLDGVDRSGLLERVAASPLLAQKVVHETLRVRPMTPRIKRRAVESTAVAGVEIPKGARVVLDIYRANRDPALYGDDPEAFDPERVVRDDVPLWGYSFGAGPHICIGRSVAGGLPLHGAQIREGVADKHLYGLVAHMVQAVAARGVMTVPEDPPVRDERTTRGSRWLRFPARFPERVSPGGDAGGSTVGGSQHLLAK